ncbi:MAG: S24/S26 family peptidase [Oscillospiraceae bacterium]|nr:S24/S26 family peptidase [Oscillospiraceae bacterium]
MTPLKVILPNAILLGEVTRLLEEGRQVVIMTKGASMSPFIRGDRDSVELSRMDTVEVGDIVLCQLTPGHYVLHRVHALDGDAVQLKGDGNLDSTESCTLKDVCGTVTAILRKGRRRIDCRTPRFMRMSRRWVAAPRIVRRYILGFYRRIKFL